MNEGRQGRIVKISSNRVIKDDPHSTNEEGETGKDADHTKKLIMIMLNLSSKK